MTSSKRNRAKAFSVRQVEPSCGTLHTVNSSIRGLTQHQTAPQGNMAVLTSSLFGASMPTERYSWLLPFTQTPAGKPSPLNVTYGSTSQSQASARDLSPTVTWCVDGVAKYSTAKGTKTMSFYLPKQLTSIPETTPFQVLGNNFDLTVSPSSMTKDKQRKSWYWFLVMATKLRVTRLDLPDNGPRADVETLDSENWLPSPNDVRSLNADQNFHIVHSLVQLLPFLREFQECVPPHIDHPHLEETSKQRFVLNCELIDASGNSMEGIIKIVNRVHDMFVPTDSQGNVAEPCAFTGDVLTNERAFSAQQALRNGKTGRERGAGLLHRPEGLHRNIVQLNPLQ